MSAGVVEARFAGGAILVDTDDVAGAPVVTVDMPGGTPTAMFPDEARRFAVTLIEQAARAEAAPAEGVWP